MLSIWRGRRLIVMNEPIIIVIIVSECNFENFILSMPIQVMYYSDVIIMCRNPLVK